MLWIYSCGISCAHEVERARRLMRFTFTFAALCLMTCAVLHAPDRSVALANSLERSGDLYELSQAATENLASVVMSFLKLENIRKLLSFNERYARTRSTSVDMYELARHIQ